MATAGFWLLVFGVLAPQLDEPPDSVVLYYVLGLVTVPMAFGVLAFGSRAGRPLRGTLLATAVWVAAMAAFVGIGLLTKSAALLLIAAPIAYGGGAVLALRRDDDDLLRPRLWAVSIVGLWSVLVVGLLGLNGLLMLTLFPFNAVGLADLWSMRRRRRAG